MDLSTFKSKAKDSTKETREQVRKKASFFFLLVLFFFLSRMHFKNEEWSVVLTAVERSSKMGI